MNCVGITTDWSQFIPSMIATFVGFVLALLGQAIYEHCKERSSAKSCVSSIRDELESIYNILKDIDTTDPNNILRTPVWDGIVDSYKINMLGMKGKTEGWYLHLFEKYNLIREFNKWSDIYTSKYLDIYQHVFSELTEKEVITFIDLFNAKSRGLESITLTLEQGRARLSHERTVEQLMLLHVYLLEIKKDILIGSSVDKIQNKTSIEQLINELYIVLGEKDGKWS